MPFSALVPLSKSFISKPLTRRIDIVKSIFHMRLMAHGACFTTYNVSKIGAPSKETLEIIQACMV